MEISSTTINSTFANLFLKESSLLLFSGYKGPFKGNPKAECRVVPYLLILETPVGASNRTLGLSADSYLYKSNLETAW